ncbi:MAG: PH domain-containing protein [archaeon]|uniref:PH (Pleckstrin Homology) domain-containing protein n=1 Tax=Methanobrevibacter gottschalkii DSM 11977 TaxID=1122229 RepID=A0A3N5BKP1_9EURY|nr:MULTISPECIES: PH domain-containing protein [Methanobrevibacter]MCQ2970433.1 PH domain-containing protein [archaeon]OED01059.1 hypothetical protein A9505_02630 [Methanobrevibacter sp. A27]RPF50248.1 PH (Pleckstrin Homology) domain-containing protein [Methanobrevibacter gottschalkii DSM 11977]
MLFNKNENKANERIIYKTKSNVILGCKKAIYGLVLLIIVLSISPIMIKFIAKMQVYLISQIQLPLTRYAAIAFFVIILIIVIYIIWHIIGWYSLEYTLTDSRIMVKSGVISTKKNYMPYATIQDVTTSQSILARLFHIGTVSVFSAYDNNRLELKNISNPSEVEEIIFSNMRGSRTFQPQQSRPINYHQQDNYLDNGSYLGRNEMYDEFEPITPITHEKDSYQGRDYEYYPEDRGFENSDQIRHEYEYEPYDDIDRFVEEFEPHKNYPNEIYDDELDEDYYEFGSKNHYDEKRNEVIDNDSNSLSSEKVIRRHFDKFKK